MSGGRPQDLPVHTAAKTTAARVAAGGSGTIHLPVMPFLALTSDTEALPDRYREPWTLMQDGMSPAGYRRGAAKQHREWLLPRQIAGDSTVPFREEAVALRDSFDRPIEEYDRALAERDEVPLRGIEA